jgi:hypothetical protein
MCIADMLEQNEKAVFVWGCNERKQLGIKEDI